VIVVSEVGAVPSELKPTVVTIGKFDAIHLGHQELLRETIELAEEHMLVPAVVTFDRHPSEILNPGNAPQPVIGINQKKELLDQAGIELMVALAFDDALAHSSAEDFVSEILVSGLNAKVVIVGEGFRFGAEAKGDVSLLKELGEQYGFSVRVMAPVEIDGKVVSTSRVRELLLAGEVTAAARLLGRRHATTGMVEHGLKIGREIGFPTANLARDSEGFLPRDAVYAGWLYADGERYMTALSVGINETFTAVPRLIEAHVIGVSGLDLYDKVITVEYVEFIRPAAKFNGVEDLVAEINRDLEKIKEILS
jgi:riboflavin kinase/FMN adenylyltransferase